jgi:hypothetical protein
MLHMRHAGSPMLEIPPSQRMIAAPEDRSLAS